ncbi:hypothetical protein BJ138DRAFT_1000551 [Hygrophoropsis aurantiaca]|uniref:Uncharacterized protein n=1 Tax=Hygrophoropsis aurantiaca TaxID=72124 RepID=A0ACB8AM90_9AGAM|nr:hypothetical protein BJ138DRAFT_1000551 [Hygrophoropsis aurantiaca]
MATGSDDDVPLAQRIPTALTAQRTIRKQVRDERQQRRLERASKRSDTISPKEPPAPVPLPARGATHAPRQRSISAAPAPVTEHLRRERTRHKPTPIDAFPVDDLTKKLASLQSAISPPATAPPGFNMGPLSAKIKMPGTGARTPLTSQGFDQTSFLQQQPLRSAGLSQERTLRPMRSFHRDKRSTEPSPAPADPSSQRLGRSSTSTHRRPLDDSSTRGGETSPRGISESASNNIDHLLRAARRSEDSRRPAVVPPRTSSERTRDTDSPTSREVQRPPVPPLPPIDIITSFAQQTPAKSRTTQQRIFVGDMQRFNIVEITPNTNAGDVIGLVASQGALDKSTGWMLWELAQDFGMERPIRSYELLSDVTASWNKDKMLNAFMIKTTRLASLLSRSNMPTSSPTNRGYVEWESKRGKWSKRWMELREHSLWLSKRDTGKDETFLCSLSNFDVYYVTRKHKSPKPFVFAVKSTDNLTLFEDASDYLHVFSCNQKDGEKWMDAILVARSYVLYQERHVLFAKPGDPTTSSKSLSRSGTRKQSSASRPAQPLVQVAPPSSASAVTPVAFEPGSLLAKRKGEAQS